MKSKLSGERKRARVEISRRAGRPGLRTGRCCKRQSTITKDHVDFGARFYPGDALALGSLRIQRETVAQLASEHGRVSPTL